jgi:hypothetical protein
MVVELRAIRATLEIQEVMGMAVMVVRVVLLATPVMREA